MWARMRTSLYEHKMQLRVTVEINNLPGALYQVQYLLGSTGPGMGLNQTINIVLFATVSTWSTRTAGMSSFNYRDVRTLRRPSVEIKHHRGETVGRKLQLGMAVVNGDGGRDGGRLHWVAGGIVDC